MTNEGQRSLTLISGNPASSHKMKATKTPPRRCQNSLQATNGKHELKPDYRQGACSGNWSTRRLLLMLGFTEATCNPWLDGWECAAEYPIRMPQIPSLVQKETSAAATKDFFIDVHIFRQNINLISMGTCHNHFASLQNKYHSNHSNAVEILKENKKGKKKLFNNYKL